MSERSKQGFLGLPIKHPDNSIITFALNNKRIHRKNERLFYMIMNFKISSIMLKTESSTLYNKKSHLRQTMYKIH